MPPEVLGYFEFRADAVGAGDEDRVPEIVPEPEQSGEAGALAQDPPRVCGVGGADGIRNFTGKILAGGDIYSCRSVGQGRTIGQSEIPLERCVAADVPPDVPWRCPNG